MLSTLILTSSYDVYDCITRVLMYYALYRKLTCNQTVCIHAYLIIKLVRE